MDLHLIPRVNWVCAAVHTNGPWCLLWARLLMLFRMREVQRWEDLRVLSFETLGLFNILRAG